MAFTRRFVEARLFGEAGKESTRRRVSEEDLGGGMTPFEALFALSKKIIVQQEPLTGPDSLHQAFRYFGHRIDPGASARLFNQWLSDRILKKLTPEEAQEKLSKKVGQKFNPGVTYYWAGPGFGPAYTKASDDEKRGGSKANPWHPRYA